MRMVANPPKKPRFSLSTSFPGGFASRFSWGRALGMASAFALLAPVGCGETKEPEVKDELKFKKRPKLSDMKSAGAEKSEAELAEARKELGIKSAEDVAKENAAMFEKGAREYVKTRLDGYRSLVADMRETLADVEKSGKKWAAKGKGKKKFDRFMKKFEERTKRLSDQYDELTTKGSEGGQTQAVLGVAYRNWDAVTSTLGPEVTEGEAFAKAKAEIEAKLDEVEAALTDIENDASLVAAGRG